LINKYDKRPKNEFIKDIANKRRKYRLRFEKWILLKRLIIKKNWSDKYMKTRN
jgi:hypothetical protein